MKIVIFGGSGYIAGKIVSYLCQEHDLTVADINRPCLDVAVDYHRCDIMNVEDVRDAVRGADIVYNFAAVSSLEACNADMAKAISVNLQGHVHIMQASVEAAVKKYIFASSVYSISNYGGVYGITKRAGEELLVHYHTETGLTYAGIRYGTIYGPTQGQGNSLYHLIYQALAENRIDYKGSGNELREFIHIEDAARLTSKMIEDSYKNEFYTITGSNSFALSDILELIHEIIDRDLEIVYHHTTSRYHYTKTPANIRNIVARKILSDNYIDIHQGLLDVVNSINGELFEKEQRLYRSD